VATTDFRTRPPITGGGRAGAPAGVSNRAPAGARCQTPSRPRLRGVDAARGLAVIGMLFVDNRGGGAITPQLVHVPWNGLHVADVVFPTFLLIVGVSMPFSSRAQRPRAVLWRVVKLMALGMLIVTAKYGWGVLGPGVLGHIAGAYLLCWLLMRLPARPQIPVAGAVLAVVSLLYLLVPVPGAGRAAMEPGLSWGAWLDGLVGIGAGAEGPHSYLTSAVTVFLGVLAGRVLRDRRGAAAVRRLLAGGAGLVAAGLALAHVVPLNKNLWSPSYVLLTGGIGLGVLAATHWLVDLRGVTRPLRFAEVLGRNAIVAFAVSELLFRAVLGDHAQPALVGWMSALTSDVAAAYLYPALSVLVVWGVCWGLLRRGIVVRI
jgi:predicted acyltransferase